MKKQTKLGLVLAAAAVISVSVASLVSARGWVQNGADWYYVDNNNEYVTDTIQSSGTAKFYLGENGAMMRDYFLEDYNGNAYYFGQNGAMVTNTWVAIESSRVENQDDYIPDNYWYYFQSSGKAMKASSGKLKTTTIDGKKYGFNEFGQMATGWITSEGKVVNPDDDTNPFSGATYYAGGDNDGVLRAGWVTYYDGYDGDGTHEDKTNLYFYFNTSNNKKEANKTKKINGKTYAFDDEGVMLSGWDVYEDAGLMAGKVPYFSGEDDGHQVKKGWVFAVPHENIDSKAHEDDEEKYMYFNASGEIIRDQIKKINGKHYVFNSTGIMKTGLVMWSPEGISVPMGTGIPNAIYHYVDKLDLDWATGEELAKKGIMRYGDGNTSYIKVDPNGIVVSNPAGKEGVVTNSTQIKLHYFGEDGARKTGTNNIEFADEVFTFASNNAGDRGSGMNSKKYYSLGIQCKANSDIRYGIFNNASASNGETIGFPLQRQSSGDANNIDDTVYRQNLKNGVYLVLTTGGAKQKGNNTAKKDADGNYWMINSNTQALKGIWTQNVKANNTISAGFSTRTVRLDTLGSLATNVKASPSTMRDTHHIDGKFMWAGTNTTLDQKVFTAHVNTITNAVYWTMDSSYTGYCFQSDIGEGSNKWIPFGVVDNSGKTIIEDPEQAATMGLTQYEVKPNNDYFLNCYWID